MSPFISRGNNQGNSGNTKRNDSGITGSKKSYEISEKHSRRPPHIPPKGNNDKGSNRTR